MGEIGRRPDRAKEGLSASSLLLKKNQAPWPKNKEKIRGERKRCSWGIHFLFVARVRFYLPDKKRKIREEKKEIKTYGQTDPWMVEIEVDWFNAFSLSTRPDVFDVYE